MKYSQKQEKALSTVQLSNANKWNLPLLEGIKNRFQLDKVPAALEKALMKEPTRLRRIVPLTFDSFSERFKDVTPNRNKTSVKVVPGADAKTGQAIMYAYVPELENALVEQELCRKQQQNMENKVSAYEKQFKADAPEALKKFLLQLPANVPYQTYFDGSRQRVIRLAENEDAVMYGKSDDDVFAVVYTHRDAPVITIFVPAVDYVLSFAKQLMKVLEIDEELAMKISAALPHDQYYSVYPTPNDFERYATNMARLLKVNEGDTVKDLLQGDVDIVMGSFSKKLAVDVDDELPSAFLIGNRVNVYLPN